MLLMAMVMSLIYNCFTFENWQPVRYTLQEDYGFELFFCVAISFCLFTESPETAPKQPAAAPASSTADADNTTYKCNEYYSFNEFSFYDIESAMSSKRVGQPSANVKPTK